MSESGADRYVRNRAAAIELLGGRCADCATTENLQFDHIIAGSKKYEISVLLTGYAQATLLSELAKCALRCKPCHDAKTVASGETGGGWNKLDDSAYQHGTARMYSYQACRCEPCRTAHRLYGRGLIAVGTVVTAEMITETRTVTAKGTHGTISAYRYCGPPKCEECKRAKRDAMRAWMAKKRKLGDDS